MKKNLILCIILFLLVGSSSTSFSQAKFGKVGKIFMVEEANNLFGEIKAKQHINTAFLKKVMKKAKHYLRFKLRNNMLSIFEDTKDMEKWKEKFSVNAITVDSDPEFIYSVESIEELLKLGGSEVTTVEDRGKVLTLSNGAYTLEMALACPPWCPR